MKRHIAALVASAALLGACHDATGVPDLNNVSSETLAGALTTSGAQLMVTGLFNQYRNSAIGNYYTFPETMARDALRIDKAETRYLTEMIGNVQPDNGAFTGGRSSPASSTAPRRQIAWFMPGTAQPAGRA